MRFMVMIKASEESEADVEPEEGLLLKMGRYNEALVEAGVLVDGAGLMSSSRGARVQIVDGKPIITDGPIAHGQDRFEIRQMHELEDFATEGEGYELHKKVEARLAARDAGA